MRSMRDWGSDRRTLRMLRTFVGAHTSHSSTAALSDAATAVSLIVEA
jgi:hypothetical protein